MDLRRHLFRPLSWAALIFAYVAAIVPQADAPQIASSDKVEHMIAFFTLAVLSRLAYPAVRARVPWLLLAAFGALIEFTQLIPALHRDGNLADWIADLFALTVGLLVAMLGMRVAARR